MRQIYLVNATQVVTSDSHPEGTYSVMPNYPVIFDSRNYNATEENPNGDETKALDAAKAEYFSRLSALYIGSNTRVMWTVTLLRADGRIIMRESRGGFPDMTPVPEPEPVEEPVEEPVDNTDDNTNENTDENSDDSSEGSAEDENLNDDSYIEITP